MNLEILLLLLVALILIPANSVASSRYTAKMVSDSKILFDCRNTEQDSAKESSIWTSLKKKEANLFSFFSKTTESNNSGQNPAPNPIPASILLFCGGAGAIGIALRQFAQHKP